MTLPHPPAADLHGGGGGVGGRGGWLVSDRTRDAFEGLETQRVDGLVVQFQKEFDRRKQEIVRAVDAIADSGPTSRWPGLRRVLRYARSLASTHGLDLLELVAAMAPSSLRPSGRRGSAIGRSG